MHLWSPLLFLILEGAKADREQRALGVCASPVAGERTPDTAGEDGCGRRGPCWLANACTSRRKPGCRRPIRLEIRQFACESGTVSPSTDTEPAFEAICALPGFCRIEKRSPTLDGSLPLRAAQHCSPVFEGNSAGFQIRLEQPLTLHRGRRGVEFNLTPPAYEVTQGKVKAAVEKLVTQGLLRSGGYWHRLLGEDAIPAHGSRVWLWSGFLVKPRSGVWLRISRAFNRASRIRVVEHLIADDSAYTPLVLEIDARALPSAPLWLEGEIGCLLPVCPKVQMSMARVGAGSVAVKQFEGFFDSEYFALKAVQPTSRYRKRVREQNETDSAPACDARVLFAGPPVHELRTLDRFVSSQGFSKRGPANEPGLPVGRVGNVARIRATWDGQSLTKQDVRLEPVLRQLAHDWKRAGGRVDSDAFEFLSGYMLANTRDEPFCAVQPWVFVETSPGWSTVVEGIGVGDTVGMRGVIHTDSFHALAVGYRFYAPQSLDLRRGTPLIDFLPVPRDFLTASMLHLET